MIRRIITVGGIGIVLATFIGLAVFVFGNFPLPGLLGVRSVGSPAGYSTDIAPVTRQTITSSVKVNDVKLVPVEDSTLSFLAAGKIKAIHVREGDSVQKDTLLIELDTRQFELELSALSQQLTARRATLAKLEAGSRTEDVNIVRARHEAAQSRVQDTETIFATSLNSAYVESYEAVHDTVGQFFSFSGNGKYDLSFNPKNAQEKIDLESHYPGILDLLVLWNSDLGSLSGNLTERSKTSKSNLKQITDFLGRVAFALDDTVFESSRGAILSGQSKLIVKLQAIDDAESSYRTAIEAEKVAREELLAIGAPARGEDIDVAEASVSEITERMGIVRDNIVKSKLTSEYSEAIVKKIYPKVGEVLQVGAPAILLSSDDLKVRIDIPDEDIGYIREGNAVRVSLKAFPEHSFTGTISSIEPNEVLRSGSTYFRANAILEPYNGVDLNVRAGMTGYAYIDSTKKKENALTVPLTAVYYLTGEPHVKKSRGGKGVPTPVTLGIRDAETQEIVGGLAEGDEVFVFP
jgi:multidrug efflux pump subunit AcrA (membrane-fusion protein)